MASSDVKTLVELKKENERLQEIANFLEMENFDYALKCNRMENALSNIQTVIQNHPKKLVEASEHLCGILGACSTTRTLVNNTETSKENSINKSKSSERLTTEGNLVVVKPHMVNGTILYIPTINLTRVSELHSQTNTENSGQREIEDNSLERTLNTNLSLPANETEAGPSSTVQDVSGENQITHLEDVSEASSSKSPSHSTVLSGTFQEVKIFLNQISQESHSEEPRKSVNLRRRSKQFRNKYRSGDSSKCVSRRSK